MRGDDLWLHIEGAADVMRMFWRHAKSGLGVVWGVAGG